MTINKLKTKVFFLILTTCLFPVANNAQNKELNCYQKALKASGMFSEANNTQELIQILTPCMRSGDPDATYMLANALLKGKPTKKNLQQAYHLTRVAAEKDHPEAACALGLIYSDGIGCETNLKKSVKWYKKAIELGNHKAMFNLGYYYFKGIGVPQDYTKAIDLFTKSSYPMAKHWLGVCHFYGYGLEQNRDEAISLLQSNPILNSQTLVKQFIEGKDKSPIEKIELAPNNTFKNHRFNVSASYEGDFLEYDASGKQIFRKIPLQIDLQLREKKSEVDYIIRIRDKEKTGVATFSENTLTFTDLSLEIERPLKDNPYRVNVQYEIQSMTISKQKVDGKKLLIGELKGFIPEWKEPTPPIKIIVKKDVTKLSKETLRSLNSQKNSFIQLYPNPFQDDLVVRYKLKNTSNVTVTLRDFYGNTKKIITKGKTENTGKHLHFIDGSDLKKGVYIISVSVNGSDHTKVIVKN